MGKTLKNYEGHRIVQKSLNSRDPSECWIWPGGKVPAGYGRIIVDGNMIDVREYAKRLAGQERPEGFIQVMLCERRDCFNPDHSEFVSRSEKAQRQARRRQAKGLNWSKLSNDQVLEICELYDAGTFNQQQLADRYGVHNGTVSRILNGKQMAWLTGR